MISILSVNYKAINIEPTVACENVRKLQEERANHFSDPSNHILPSENVPLFWTFKSILWSSYKWIQSTTYCAAKDMLYLGVVGYEDGNNSDKNWKFIP